MSTCQVDVVKQWDRTVVYSLYFFGLVPTKYQFKLSSFCNLLFLLSRHYDVMELMFVSPLVTAGLHWCIGSSYSRYDDTGRCVNWWFKPKLSWVGSHIHATGKHAALAYFKQLHANDLALLCLCRTVSMKCKNEPSISDINEMQERAINQLFWTLFQIAGFLNFFVRTVADLEMNMNAVERIKYYTNVENEPYKGTFRYKSKVYVCRFSDLIK